MSRTLSGTVHECINNVLTCCSDNVPFYEGYLFANYPRIERDVDFIVGYIDVDSKLLDIGGVPPLFVELLRMRGMKKLFVADPHPEPFQAYWQKNAIEVVKCDMLNIANEHDLGIYDVVCMNEVVEHIGGNLLTAVENALSLLKTGGLLYVTTPNLRSLTGLVALVSARSGLATKPHDGVRAQYERNSSEYGYFGHVREYTADEIVDLFYTYGCKLVGKQFQADYRKCSGLFKLAQRLEVAFPKWGLFGKYVFRKSR